MKYIVLHMFLNAYIMYSNARDKNNSTTTAEAAICCPCPGNVSDALKIYRFEIIEDGLIWVMRLWNDFVWFCHLLNLQA